MPYRPNVTDRSGEIRAQGMVQSTNNLARTAQDFGNRIGKAIEDRKKKEEADKQFLAQSKATESFLKANPDIFAQRDASGAAIPGSGRAVIDQITAVEPNTTPAQRAMKLNQFMKMGIAGQDISKAQAETQRAMQEVASTRAKAEEFAKELKRRDAANDAMKDPDLIKFLDDPSTFVKVALAKNIPYDILSNNPLLLRQMDIKSRDDLNATKLEGERALAAAKAKQENEEPRPGYRWKAGSNKTEMEPIPGSAEEASLKKTKMDIAASARAEEKEKILYEDRRKAFETDIEESRRNIQKAKKLIVEKGAGGKFENLAAKFGAAPSTDALQSLYTSIRGAQLVNKMSELKSFSPTGSTGAGQLNELEGRAFASTVSELDASQKEDFQLERLQNLDRYLEKMLTGKEPEDKTPWKLSEEKPREPIEFNRFLVY